MSELIPTSCIMFIPNRHSARGWLSGDSAKTFLDSRYRRCARRRCVTGASPCSVARILAAGCLVTAANAYADFAETASYAVRVFEQLPIMAGLNATENAALREFNPVYDRVASPCGKACASYAPSYHAFSPHLVMSVTPHHLTLPEQGEAYPA